MQSLLGFVIALAIGLTGVGGGSFTTPALVLLAGIPGAEAVGTALAFTTIVRMVAIPFYWAGKQVHLPYLRLMLIGALPGVVSGGYLLRRTEARFSNPVVLIAIGAVLVISALLTVLRPSPAGRLRERPSRWLAWLALPIGIETGFSSAGSGAMGTLLLFNFSGLDAAEVVGTDLAFGTAIAATGALFHFTFGNISATLLSGLLLGGIPGALVGCVLARRVPPRRVRRAILFMTALLGVALLMRGAGLLV
ncbi:MAG: sulfite exporter TauE/SafE family protein [Actinomycetota bacterium]